MLGLYLCFNDTATTEIYTLSLHDALPICEADDHDDAAQQSGHDEAPAYRGDSQDHGPVQDEHAEAERQDGERKREPDHKRSEEHTSELQSRQYLVCRLLLEKKNNNLFHLL